MIWIAVAVLFLICPTFRRHPDRAHIRGRYIAHRGLHGDGVPENSLTAYRKAAERGFAIEIDIHLTADGEVVVFHDDTLTRVCGVDRKVEESTLAELKSYRLLGTQETIPTLQECLDTVDGKVPLLIEFKCVSYACRDLCERANAVLSAYTGKYWVQSFYPFVLRWYKKNRKDICRGQLAERFQGEALHKRLLGCMVFNFLSRPDFVSYNHEHADHPARRLVTKLGALPVGWTFTAQEAVNACKDTFAAYIFEGFTPDAPRQNT